MSCPSSETPSLAILNHLSSRPILFNFKPIHLFCFSSLPPTFSNFFFFHFFSPLPLPLRLGVVALALIYLSTSFIFTTLISFHFFFISSLPLLDKRLSPYFFFSIFISPSWSTVVLITHSVSSFLLSIILLPHHFIIVTDIIVPSLVQHLQVWVIWHVTHQQDVNQQVRSAVSQITFVPKTTWRKVWVAAFPLSHPSALSRLSVLSRFSAFPHCIYSLQWLGHTVVLSHPVLTKVLIFRIAQSVKSPCCVNRLVALSRPAVLSHFILLSHLIVRIYQVASKRPVASPNSVTYLWLGILDETITISKCRV